MRDARPERGELFRVLQELDDLGQFELRLFLASDVQEGNGRLLAGEHPRLALAEGHRLRVGALCLPHHEDKDRAKDDQRQEVDQQPKDVAELARAPDLHLHGALTRAHGDVVVAQQLLDGGRAFLA